MTSGRIERLAGVGLTVSSLSRAEAIYRDGLGFARCGPEAQGDAASFGLRGRVRSLGMSLGAQFIELAEFEPAGQPYPDEADAADIRFQHFAIVVGDMAAAHEQVRQQPGFRPISTKGPQTLPPSSGSVIAFKFRDPDGHPLELLQFPAASQPWGGAPPGAVWLGIDHSAIVVSDADRSIAFYTRELGMSVAARSHNTGPAQQRLDGLAHDSVDVIALGPAAVATPHIELLAYRTPPVPPDASARAPANDIAATRLLLEGRPPEGIEPGRLFHDPDGHALLMTGPLQR